MIWVWNLLPVVLGCCPPSSPALALTLVLTPGGKWCRPTDPTDSTMLILSARHTLLITLLILSALRWYFADHTAPVWYVQQGTHICASVARRAPLQKGTLQKHYKAVCVMLCWYFQQGTPCFYCVDTALILCSCFVDLSPLAKRNIRNITRQPVLTPGGNCPSATYNPDTFSMAPSNGL